MPSFRKCVGSFLLSFAVLTQTVSSHEFIEDAQYYRMPKLSEVDDYDQCMGEKMPGEVRAFCMTRVVIRPDNNSDLWRLIKNFSKYFKIHENHALLERGVCMSKCEKLVRSLPAATRQALRVPKFPIHFGYIFNDTQLEHLPLFKGIYGELVDICINYNLNASYGLSGYTEIESCDKSDESLEVDLWDQFCLVVIGGIVLMVILSSYYDKSINIKQSDEHYKTDLNDRRSSILVTFSLFRNWYRLIHHSLSPTSRDLRVFQGFRFFTLFGVMWGHVYASYFFLAIQNSLEVEKGSHNLITMLEFEGTRIVQTFFIFGAFLLAVTVMENEDKIKKSSGLLVLLKAICNRYLRLTPAHALMILITATWYPKLQDGPWWKARAGNDRSMCRQTWWANLLYINNFSSRLCMDQTWYLGCDFQLFILGMIILLAVIRFKNYLKSVLSLAMAVAIIWPAVTVYYSTQEGTYIDAVQYRKFFYAYDDTFTTAIASPQVNLGNYIIAIIAGMIYLKFRRSNIDLSRKWWSCIGWILLYGIGTLLFNAIFYWNDFPKPSLWMAIFFPLSRCSWGVINCIMLLGLIFGAVPKLNKFLSHRIFESLGRLTYSAYLCHLAVLRLLLYSTRTPFHVSISVMLLHTISIAVVSYLIALLMYLLYEKPIISLFYVLFEKSSDPIKTEISTTIDGQTLITASSELKQRQEFIQ